VLPQSTEKLPRETSAELGSFGGRLKWLRQQRGLTLAEFGSRIKASRSYLSRLENGKNTRTSEQFLHIVCQNFRVSREWLLNGKGEVFDQAQASDATENKAWPLEGIVSKEALYIVGAWISAFNFDVKGIANLLLKVMEEPIYEPHRTEIVVILLNELVAQINNCGEIQGSGKPMSDFGKKAIKALEEFKSRNQRQKTLVTIQPSQKTSRDSTLTNVVLSDNIDNVKAQLPALLKRLNEMTRERGTKTALAKFMGVKLPTVSRWLSGDKEPGGETTLKLLHWVEQQERQK